MKRLINKKLNRVLSVVLTIAALMTGQVAMAESTWTVEYTSHNTSTHVTTFTIKRSQTGYAQTVLYRTVGLSAYAGQHFTATSGSISFTKNEDEKTVTVTEKTPASNAYKYQTGDSRKYRFEVTDRAGYKLASADRTMTTGTSVTSSGVFSEKSVTIRSSEVTVTDGGYAQSSNPHTVNSSSYYNSNTQAYLSFLNAQLRMTLDFQAKEKSDGYQYVQILVDNTTDCDTGAGDGNPGTISLSRYMAGFTIDGNGVDTYYNYSFPVTTAGNNEGATTPWTGINNTVGNLKKQIFNTNCRATDGKLILPTNFSTLVVRLNASGNNNDDWYARNIKANIIAVDGIAPYMFIASVNPGRHAKGNTVYVSVAFSEIVTVTGTPTLTTTSENNWGSLTYETGSGTNVLTFKGTIPQDATGSLNITGLSGTVKDLAGNSLSGGVTASNLCTLDGDLAYAIGDFQTEDGNYLIACHDDLWGLASYVNGGGDTENKTFLQVTDLVFPHTTIWNNSSSTENNFTAIGKSDNNYRFKGTYDGDGHTISGIRIYKGGDSDSDKYQGLFGYIQGGTVRNVTLADTRITGQHHVGGIAGNSNGTVESCTVDANVCIHAVQNDAQNHGGIVGDNNSTIRQCISRATLTVPVDNYYRQNYGGIAGVNNYTISDCIADGVVIPDTYDRGAIVGYKHSGTLTRNYYYNCKVASNNVTPSGVGMGTKSQKSTSDGNGARALFAITLGTNVTLDRTPEATLPGTNNKTYTDGADINGQPYAYNSAWVTLGYSGVVGTGYYLAYSTTAGTISGNILMMPTAAVTVSATVTDVWGVESQCNGSAEHPYTISTTQGLDLLAQYVNGGNDCSTLHFQLGGPISYTHGNSEYENNYTAIGGNYNNDWKTFRGTFDGKGNTISGIRIYKYGNTNPESYQGLFGCTLEATIKNVILADTRITGYQDVGGIVGYNVSGGIVKNCRIGSDVTIHARFSNAKYHGGVVGYLDGGTISGCVSAATLTVDDNLTNINYYGGIVGYREGSNSNISDCLVIGATVPSTSGGAIGHTHSGIQTNSYYRDCTEGNNTNQSNAYTVSAGTDVTAAPAGDADATYDYDGIKRYDSALYYNGVLYAPNNAEVSLTLGYTGSVPTGLVPRYTPTAGTLTGTGNPYTLTMPEEDVTVNAALAVPYIDEDGTEKTCTDFTLLQSSTGSTVTLGTAGEEHWFAVSGDVSITHTNSDVLYFYGAARLILCDGASLTLSGSSPLSANGNLVIYGQSQGNGSLSAEGSGTAILVTPSGTLADDGTLTINGGSITAHSTGTNGIYVNNSVTINGGTVSTSCDYQIGNGITSYGDITINGGTVSATGGSRGWGIYAKYNITLGYTSADDRIYANSYRAYNGTVSIKDGQAFSNGSETLGGTITDMAKLNGKTLVPAVNAIPYIDADGSTKWCGEYTVIESNEGNVTLGNSSNYEKWYAVRGTVTINGQLNINDQNVHLILCDGASLTVNNATSTAINCIYVNLTIYGQSEQSGTLITTTNDNGSYSISSNETVTINGGTVNATNSLGSAIYATDDITINGGTVTATGYYGLNCSNTVTINGGTVTAHGGNDYYGIYGYNNVTINGGIINADSPNKAIYVNSSTGTLTLGWTNATDRITASSYGTYRGGTIRVKDGQILTDGTNYYSGTLTSEQIAAMANQTLQPFVPTGVTLATVGEYLTATFNGTSLETVNIPAPISVKQVTLNRTFSADKASTVMLPFDYTCNNNEGGTFYRFVGVEKENNTWVATMQATGDGANNAGTLTANTPYLFMPTGTSITFTIPSEGVTLNTTGGGNKQTADAGSHWTFKGTYAYKEWIADGANSAEIGSVYGFAGVQKEGINVGDFVKVKSGAKIRPMCAYLIWNDTPNSAPRHRATEELPQSIVVKLIGANGTVTGIGTLDTTTGDVTFDSDAWYDMSGRKLDGKPTTKGLYINNGRKVVIK